MAINDKPLITKAGQENQDTGQSGGLQLLTGVGQQNTPATRIWLGKATNAPGTRSLPHHHGEAETAFYVISGQLRMFFGKDFGEYVDATDGDFAFVPAQMPHIEANMKLDTSLSVLVARSPKDILINLPDVEDSSLPGYQRV